MKKIYSLSIIAIFLFSIGSFAQCTITSGPTVTPNGLSISVTGTGTGAGFAAYGYDWGDATTPGFGQTCTHTYASGGTYTLCMYYLDATDTSCHATNCIQLTVTGIADPTLPALSIQTTPNPFSSEVSINLSLNGTQNVEMAIYDLTGKQIAVLKNGMMQSGNNVLYWKPVGVSEGIYFLQVKAGDTVLTKKIVYSGN